MLYECRIKGAIIYAIAPSLRWVQEFLKARLLAAGDRGQTVPSIKLVQVTNRELVAIGLGQRILDKAWGEAEISQDGHQIIRLAAHRHHQGEAVFWEARSLSQGPHGDRLDRRITLLKNPLDATRSSGARY